MISPNIFVDSLGAMQMDFFTGVPDSLLKNICAYLTLIPQHYNLILFISS